MSYSSKDHKRRFPERYAPAQIKKIEKVEEPSLLEESTLIGIASMFGPLSVIIAMLFKKEIISDVKSCFK
jgi:hypothetical protein